MSRSDYDDLCFDLTDDEHAVLDLRRRGMDTDQDDREYKRRYAEDMR
jgi:hypothetical protein